MQYGVLLAARAEFSLFAPLVGSFCCLCQFESESEAVGFELFLLRMTNMISVSEAYCGSAVVFFFFFFSSSKWH
ncbi:hypothetical protein F5Y08DRAFT_315562, partial [Xylaria arbuscula]